MRAYPTSRAIRIGLPIALLSTTLIPAIPPALAAGERPHGHLEAFERGWEAVHRELPADPEGTLFYALAHLATADPLGLWQESIEWNRRSAEAALEHPMGDALSIHYLHALDYLAYAHLQRGEDRQAEEVLETVRGLEGPFFAEVATPYTLAAVPARLALERGRWAEAARLAPPVPAAFPWERFPAIEAITHFARARAFVAARAVGTGD